MTSQAYVLFDIVIFTVFVCLTTVEEKSWSCAIHLISFSVWTKLPFLMFVLCHPGTLQADLQFILFLMTHLLLKQISRSPNRDKLQIIRQVTLYSLLSFLPFSFLPSFLLSLLFISLFLQKTKHNTGSFSISAMFLHLLSLGRHSVLVIVSLGVYDA